MRTKSVWFVIASAVLIEGCVGTTSESSSSESYCEDSFAECNSFGDCLFSQVCVEDRCHEEEGYESDGDFYYESQCTSETSYTEIAYHRDGGPGVARTRTDTSECRYKEEEDFWDNDYDEDFDCDESSDFVEVQVECAPVSCDSCTPSCD